MYMKKLVITSLILSIIACVAISIIVIYIICAKGDIDLSLGEGVIGIVVALLALLVTIILGWQIYTAIDIKEKIAAIDELQNKQNSQEHRMEQMYYESCRTIGSAMAAIGVSEPVHSFRWLLSAFAFSIKKDKPTDVEKLLSDLKRSVNAIKAHSNLEENYIDEITRLNKSIRQSAHYTCIASTYEAIYQEFEQKVEVGQK